MIHKARTYLNSVLDQALEQEFLGKNPARKLDKPPSQKRQAERVLTEEELPKLFEKLSGRDRLITEIFLFCGLRPGELFVVRWSDWERHELRIDEAIWQGRIGETKTPTSSGFVSLPSGIEAQLRIWKQVSHPADLPPGYGPVGMRGIRVGGQRSRAVVGGVYRLSPCRGL